MGERGSAAAGERGGGGERENVLAVFSGGEAGTGDKLEDALDSKRQN